MAIQQEVCREYLRKFPTIDNRTLAKLLSRERPLVFPTTENARAIVRYVRGAIGKKNRNFSADSSMFRDSSSIQFYKSLPEPISELNGYEAFEVDGKKALVVADIHVPFYDRFAVAKAMDAGKAEGVDTVILLGDTADFYSGSKFETNPEMRDWAGERDSLITLLESIRDYLPSAEIIYKVGNHDERYESYIMRQAPELFGIEIFSFSNFIQSDRIGITVVGDRRIMKLGKLNLVHGHEFGRSLGMPVNAARWLYLQGKAHAVCGHLHATSSHTENSMDDDFTTTWSIGCLCDLHPRYRPINKWNHGFSLVERDGKNFQVHNYKIIDGKIYAG